MTHTKKFISGSRLSGGFKLIIDCPVGKIHAYSRNDTDVVTAQVQTEESEKSLAYNNVSNSTFQESGQEIILTVPCAAPIDSDSGSQKNIEVHVTLPENSDIAIASASGRYAHVYGPFVHVNTSLGTGNTRISQAVSVTASTVSGEIHVTENIQEDLTVSSQSGRVWIDGYQGKKAKVSSVSGEIRMRLAEKTTGTVSVRTDTGPIRIYGSDECPIAYLDVESRWASVQYLR